MVAGIGCTPPADIRISVRKWINGQSNSILYYSRIYWVWELAGSLNFSFFSLFLKGISKYIMVCVIDTTENQGCIAKVFEMFVLENLNT